VIPTTARAILDELNQKDAQVLNLLALCRTQPYLGVWEEGPELVRRFARLLLKQGHPTLALESAARGLDNYPDDPELLYCRALALARCDSPSRAQLAVEELLDQPELPQATRSDAVSLAGRIYKDLAARTTDPTRRSERFRQAFDCYLEAWHYSGDTFPGINAASLALLAGDAETSRDLAGQVRNRVLAQLAEPGQERDYWLLATLGEAYLLLGDQRAAMGRYSQAVQRAREAHADGDIASMSRQLRLLKERLPIGDDLLGLFQLAPVIVFAGHGLDYPGAPLRFPADPALEEAVRRAIQVELDAIQPTIGYCNPGCGSSILFAELMRERNAEMHLVLPFVENDFVTECLTYGLAELEPWRRRYEELRGVLRVTRHFATTEPFLDDQVLHDFAGIFLQGLALTRAAQVGVDVVALVVQDATPESAPSGVTTFIDNWKRTGRELRVIDLATLRRSVSLTAPPLPAPAPRPPRITPQRNVYAMLFADVAGFSGLPEIQLPAFFLEFLRLVEQELKTTRALFQNTWGDGLYLVFEDVVTCARFALGLLERLKTFDFARLGFKPKKNKKPGVRIGLHTGPVFEGYDAVLRRNNYFGSHVSRAARIEPVTAPGCAFVSEQFAAALALSPGREFVCEYLGLQPLDKDYDICPLYRLAARSEFER
jgi:class 3 adenylate cyclase/tetratricopeptide (TPR) repeat protein